MFDDTEFLDDLYKILIREANKISKRKLAELQISTFGNNIKSLETGYESAYRRVIGRVAGENVFRIVFGKKSLKAFITEFGSGSKMAGSNENPYLDKYLSNRFYNPSRSKSPMGGNIVRSWGEGSYNTFDWNSNNKNKSIKRDGGNRVAGIDIETGVDTGKGWHSGKYTPRKPNFTMRRITRECQQELTNVLQNTFEKLINTPKYYSHKRSLNGKTKNSSSRMFTMHINWGRK